MFVLDFHRWSKLNESISYSAMTVYSCETLSIFLWSPKNAPSLTDCLWSHLTAREAHCRSRRARVRTWTSRPPLQNRPSRSPTPDPCRRKSCLLKTSCTDWTCRSNSPNKPPANWKRMVRGKRTLDLHERLSALINLLISYLMLNRSSVPNPRKLPCYLLPI